MVCASCVGGFLIVGRLHILLCILPPNLLCLATSSVLESFLGFCLSLGGPAVGMSWWFLRIALLTSLTFGTIVLPFRVFATLALCGGMMVMSLLSSSLWSLPGGPDSVLAAVLVLLGMYSRM